MVKIKEIPINDRPMERLIENGVETLSNEELLAIIIRTGTKRESSKIVATKILSEYGSVENLKDANIENLVPKVIVEELKKKSK